MLSPGLFLIVALCGGLGACLRFVLDALIKRWLPAPLPWGTILVNLSGSFALGALTGLMAQQLLSAQWLAAIGSGLLGGYTTFSAASFETVRLLQAGRLAASLANALGTLAGAVLAALLGYHVAGLF
ncbi:fluoride efflux transporter CrcB [Glutamicibacter sp. AGC13]